MHLVIVKGMDVNADVAVQLGSLFSMTALQQRSIRGWSNAPTQPVPVIRQHPKEPVRQISMMKWGLIPHWAKDASGAASTINARSETASTKPAFRDPIRFRRCLVPAYAFYEREREKPHRSSHFALKFARASCSRSLGCGTDGRAPRDNG
jgi:putative SOS response-associated peptidase YedK